MRVKYFLIAAVVVTIVMFYFTMATGALSDSKCYGGQYSLFSENEYCRTPSMFATAFYVSLSITTSLAIVLFRRRFLT